MIILQLFCITPNANIFSLFKKKNYENAQTKPLDTKDTIETLEDLHFVQSGSFRGFRRYRLTIYEEPGVADGIEHFRDNDAEFLYDIKRGLPVRLLIKRIYNQTFGEQYRVLEVYVDGHKVGVMYNSNGQYEDLFSSPFDKVHVRIDGPQKIIHKNGIDYRPIVYLFVHYKD